MRFPAIRSTLACHRNSPGLGFLEIVERDTGCVHGNAPRQLLPSPHGLIAVRRIDVDEARLAAGTFTSDERRAATAKTVENGISTSRGSRRQ